MATERQLIESIQAEISLSCSQPYKLPEPEVKRIISRAKDWMFDNYQYAVEEKVLALPLAIFEHEDFRNNRMIQMPDCVVAVYELREASGMGIIGTPDRDFGENKILGAEINLSPFYGDNLMYRTVMYSYWDLSKAYLLETVAFKYNKNTKRISVLGRNPIKDCFARVYTKIPDESLYDDELFVRYCYAQAKINLGRILQLFNFNLPGGISINFDAVKQDGLQEMTDIKAQIDSENNPSWFLQWN